MVTIFPNGAILEPLYVTPFHKCALVGHPFIFKCKSSVPDVKKLCSDSV